MLSFVNLVISFVWTTTDVLDQLFFSFLYIYFDVFHFILTHDQQSIPMIIFFGYKPTKLFVQHESYQW